MAAGMLVTRGGSVIIVIRVRGPELVATARHDTASTKFPAELRARYRNLSLRMCPGETSGEL